ncbi:MAG TPA: pseudouridine synthase [Candidatus Saccharimonadales bacterium]|jgi:23S rRNA pseudouridine2605 synthase|nr:pseudouridine synthase [Candidatus Saccharimonadales bacterium]
MRINRFIASATGMSRRVADAAIRQGQVSVNDQPPQPGQDITNSDVVTYRGRRLRLAATQTIILNKPVGYVVSREGQGSRTIYDLLPPELHHLKPIGRLDKDSSGLLLLTNDGQLAQELTHPKYQKTKMYEVTLDAPLQPLHRQMIAEIGLQLEDGRSKLGLERLRDGNDTAWRVTMQEGRNRQIRRTFTALGYEVITLHRTQFGTYALPPTLKPGNYAKP